MEYNKNIVYYIYVPAYRSNSAGIRVLYRLYELIELITSKAWLVVHNPKDIDTELFSKRKWKILDKETVKRHSQQNLIPIVFYSETVVGNPLNASNIIRYILNFPGILGGPKSFPADEVLVSYSKTIADSLNYKSKVLFIPAVDLNELPTEIKKSNINLVYAGKYRAFIGEPVFDYGVPVEEIFREGPRRQNRHEVLSLLAKANRIYVWENSTIATEAILMGTPVVFIRNPFLKEIIAENELSPYGYTFENTPKSISRARRETSRAKLKYLKVEQEVENNVKHFLFEIQSENLILRSQKKLISIPTSRVINLHRWKLLFSYIKNFGLVRAAKIAFEFGYLRLKKPNKKNARIRD